MLPPGRGSVRLGEAQSEPRSMRDGKRAGRLGHGDRRMGSAADAESGAHRADRQRARAKSSCAASDIGTGTYTIMAQVAADMLGLPLEQYHASSLAIRRCRNPRSKADRGSAASVSHAIAAAADAVREELSAPGQEDAGFAARRRRARRGRARRRQDRQQAGCYARRVDR